MSLSLNPSKNLPLHLLSLLYIKRIELTPHRSDLRPKPQHSGTQHKLRLSLLSFVAFALFLLFYIFSHILETCNALRLHMFFVVFSIDHEMEGWLCVLKAWNNGIYCGHRHVMLLCVLPQSC